MSVADRLTWIRIVFSFVFSYFLSIYGFLFLLLTDWLDGVLARKFGDTRFGAWLDPFADKVFIWSYSTALFFSVPHNVVFTVFLLILFLGDFFSTIERTIAYKAGKNVKANKRGKYKMAFHSAAAFSFLLTFYLYDEGIASADAFWSVRTSHLGFLFLGMALWSMLLSLKEKIKQWRA